MRRGVAGQRTAYSHENFGFSALSTVAATLPAFPSVDIVFSFPTLMLAFDETTRQRVVRDENHERAK
jgi:hypothetical protein